MWETYKYDNSISSRHKLATCYHELARSIAASIYNRRPDNEVEFGDYLQYASIGLLESIDRYSPDKGASFHTFASYRIKGSVLNGVQTATEKRSQVQYSQRVRKLRIKSLSENRLESDSDAFSEIVDITIGLAIGYMLEGTGLMHDTAESTRNDPYKENTYDELCQCVLYAVDKLPKQQNLVISYHYFQYMAFDQIAQLMKLTKGRISQVHKKAILNIKNYISHENVDSYY